MDRALSLLLALASTWVVALEPEGHTPGKKHNEDLVVLLQGEDTIDAKPYYQRITIKESEFKKATRFRPTPDILELKPSRSNPVSLKERFPVTTSLMKPGNPTRLNRDHVYQPFFLLGMDTHSIAWMRQYYQDLSVMQAHGIIVQADDWEAWLALKAEALQHGITLTLLSGDALAQMYGISRYPVLVVGKGIEQ